MTKKAPKTDLVSQASKAVRVLPTSEALVQRSYGVLEKLITQIEVKAANGALDRDDVVMFRQAQQALTELRKDEREQLKSGADDKLSDEEAIALLEAQGIDVSKLLTSK